MKAVKSTDPRKADFVKALRLATDCTKVTCVKEDDFAMYGNCLLIDMEHGQVKHPRHYTHMGTFAIPKQGGKAYPATTSANWMNE